MKKLNKITSYELYMYGAYEEWNVEYIQFDSDLQYHNIGTPMTLKQLYAEWVGCNMRNDGIFTAIIKWFSPNQETQTLQICLYGLFGELHHED